jgi:hypothetical protein
MQREKGIGSKDRLLPIHETRPAPEARIGAHVYHRTVQIGPTDDRPIALHIGIIAAKRRRRQ